jgi:polyisoprenyl-phosphate glycosyltransferase
LSKSEAPNNFKSDLFLSLVVPFRNAEGDLKLAVENLLNLISKHFSFYELILVDDSSLDNSMATVEPLLSKFENLRILRLSMHRGSDIAISAGLETAIGDCAVVLDPRRDPIEMIPKLVENCVKKPGVYFGLVPRKLGWNPFALIREGIGLAFESYCKRSLGIDIQRQSTHFRVFSRQAIGLFSQNQDTTRLMRLLTANLGVPVYPFSYEFNSSWKPDERRGFFADLDLAFELLVTSSRHPLRLVTRIGILLATANIIYAVYVVAVYVFKEKVAEGWVTLSMQSAIMFFSLFAVLAILSEYVGKILLEVRKGTAYSVQEERNSAVLFSASKTANVVDHSD